MTTIVVNLVNIVEEGIATTILKILVHAFFPDFVALVLVKDQYGTGNALPERGSFWRSKCSESILGV